MRGLTVPRSPGQSANSGQYLWKFRLRGIQVCSIGFRLGEYGDNCMILIFCEVSHSLIGTDLWIGIVLHEDPAGLGEIPRIMNLTWHCIFFLFKAGLKF